MTIQDVFEAIGAHAAGKMTDERGARARERAPARAPARAAASSPPTRWRLVIDFLGISPRGLSRHPGDASRQGAGGGRGGRMVMELVRDDTRPSQILTRDAFENAIAAVAGTGGSTNGVLHLLAIAREAGVELLDRRLRHDLGADADRRRPEAGRPLRRHRPAGGRRRRPRRARARRRRASSTTTRAASTAARSARSRTAVVERPGPGRRRPVRRRRCKPTRRPRDPARLARARGLRRQARRPRAAAAPRPGARLRLRGGLLRRGQGALDRARRRGRDPLRGPGRRARACARCCT